MYETKKVVVVATDGTPITLEVPVYLPSKERARYLREVFDGKVDGIEVDFPDGHWKGRVHVVCARRSLVEDAKEALEFMGALVDEVTVWPGGRWFVTSEGYWAHGF